MRRLILTAALLAATGAQAQVTATPEIGEALRGMGTELTREMVGGTNALYAPLHAASSAEGLTVTLDQAYGPHERHRLDVYAPEGAEGLPVMVWVHGGGFVRGDKAGAANIGRRIARGDVVVAVINYRFAPENQWPSGADDLRAVVEWLGEHVAGLGGDPSRIVLAGNSAGSMHVADYVFREELQAADDGVIGTILISPPTTDLNAREVDPERDALYYGVEADRTAQSVVNAVEGREIPVLIAYAEYEPDVIIDQTRLLIEALAARDNRLPLIASAPGHNHISVVEHIGSPDETLAPAMLGFIHAVAR